MMTTLDKNVRDSLDEVHLHVDALLQRTTTSPKVNMQTTPVSASDSALALALAPIPQPAPPPTLTPHPIQAPDPIPALDPTPATGLTPVPPPAPFQSSAHAHGQVPEPHRRHPLFSDANGRVDNHTPDDAAQPPWNTSRCMPT